MHLLIFIILFTILLWTNILALNTLPVLNYTICAFYANLAPYKVYLLTSVYALLLGKACSSTYNILNALAYSAQ